MKIGPYSLANRFVLAPMAGVTDLPFRRLARRLGAGLTVGEMVSSDKRLRNTRKSRLRSDHGDEPAPRVVQIVGSAPVQLAEAARYNVDLGADIIDINMGCPAKKVCGAAAGSALLSDELLVGRILDAVVAAVAAPVTLKIRTGPAPAQRNALQIARLAQSAGIAALTVHGRTRACAFRGLAEHDTTRAVKAAVDIPVIANGDIDSPERAGEVLAHTQADALMIGRAAQGNPWLFAQLTAAQNGGAYETDGAQMADGVWSPPSFAQVCEVLSWHLRALHAFYGEEQGVRVARKHLSWYCQGRPGFDEFWPRARTLTRAHEQLRLVTAHFDALAQDQRGKHQRRAAARRLPGETEGLAARPAEGERSVVTAAA